MFVYVMICITIDKLHMRGMARFQMGYIPRMGVVPMDMSDVLTLMISFGTLIALIMSVKDK